MRTRPRREFATTWCRMRIPGPANSGTRQFPAELTDRYDLHEIYEKAHAKYNPYLAPHGFFRKLRLGDNDHAKDFLETFGPLQLGVGERLRGTSLHFLVDLDEFWSLQLRFSLVARIYESLDDRDRLTEALLTLYESERTVSKYTKFPLGQTFGPPPISEPKG